MAWLGSLARFAEMDTVTRVEHLVIDNSWYLGPDSLSVMVEYTKMLGVVEISPDLRGVDITDMPQGCVKLTGQEFLSILVWLIRQGLLEDVGLVSTETAPRADDDGPYQCRCAVVPCEGYQGDGPPLARGDGDGEGDGDNKRGETELDVPFYSGLVQLVEGAGNPDWLEGPALMRHLHHELELSCTDISRLCDTTAARVKGALKRHRIEIVSYRGGRSKIAPRRDAPESTGR